MKKVILLVLIVLRPLFVPAQNDQELRMKNFPKTEVKADRLPKKKNLWVFILAGQSNMAGRGFVEPQDTVPSDRIFTLNKDGSLIIAKEPLHFYEPSLTGLDCGLSFGKELIQHIPDNVSLLIIPSAIGGSSISQWLGDSTFRNVKLFSNFSEKATIGRKYGTIKGVLWHQGESDANPSDIPFYANRLENLISIFRKATSHKKLPVMIGELGSYSLNNENWEKINSQIRLAVSRDHHASLIRTADLNEKGDKIHFNSQGQRILGQRFANEYITKYK